MPNSKKKLLGSARLGLSLPRLQQAETAPRHSPVAVQRPRPLNPPGSPSNPPLNPRRTHKTRRFSITSLKINTKSQIQPPQSILIKGLELAIFAVFLPRSNRQTPPNPQKKTHFFVQIVTKTCTFGFETLRRTHPPSVGSAGAPFRAFPPPVLRMRRHRRRPPGSKRCHTTKRGRRSL